MNKPITMKPYRPVHGKAINYNPPPFCDIVAYLMGKDYTDRSALVVNELYLAQNIWEMWCTDQAVRLEGLRSLIHDNPLFAGTKVRVYGTLDTDEWPWREDFPYFSQSVKWEDLVETLDMLGRESIYTVTAILPERVAHRVDINGDILIALGANPTDDNE